MVEAVRSSTDSATTPCSAKIIPVNVVVRVRPLVKRKQEEFFSPSLEISNDYPQIVIRGSEPCSNKVFAYDNVFPPSCSQEEVYRKCVSKHLENLFKGFNVTILAYGQTGSGKTYSMGTNYVSGDDVDTMGIIPRAVNDMFRIIQDKDAEAEFIVRVSFVELYSENLYDLLQSGSRDETTLEIRESQQGGIRIQGVKEVQVTSLEETMKCLEKGSTNRVTGATAMNAHSSRSHAILCLNMEQRKKMNSDDVVCSKFTLVDLAGSERAKKTKAEGQRFKEGVAINSSLLSLGQVIKILASGKEQFVPYRASKLTRLLQDSLGGNSHTVMVACVSPADDSLEETLSTLRYADNARKIKNKPIVNTDPRAAELNTLKQQIHELQLQLLSVKTIGEGVSTHSDREFAELIEQNKVLREDNESLAQKLQTSVEMNTNMAEKALMAEMSRDRLKQRLLELETQTNDTIDAMNKTLNTSVCDATSTSMMHSQLTLVKDLQRKIVDLQMEQQRSEKALVQHELSYHNAGTNTTFVACSTDDGDTETSQDCLNVAGDDASAGNGVVAADPAYPPNRVIDVEFTLRQCKLNDELTNLNKALAEKEQLMGQMVDNDERLRTMRTQYEVQINDLEARISVVMKEKVELQDLLDKMPKTAANKLAEQRRKRLQDLTAQIDDLKRKVMEKNKLLRQKENTDKKVALLSKEIQLMKQTRVKLIRQMKEDSEKFRMFKARSDREIAKLKEQERRKEFQLVKMERLNIKQQNVLKRKIEEGAAINKRLKEALALQKMCAAKRAASRGTDSNPATAFAKVKSWLETELDVVSVKIQAKHSLSALMHDRNTISSQLQKVNKNLESGVELSEAYSAELCRKREELETELKLRTAQITDIQQKCLDDDTAESLALKRFESIQTMVEAKGALSYLFDTAALHKAEAITSKQEISDIQNQYQLLVQGVEETEAELERLKIEHKNDLTRLEREHQNTLVTYLQQLACNDKETTSQEMDQGSVSVAEHQRLKDRLVFQDAEIKRLVSVHDQLQVKVEECQQLRLDLEKERELKMNPPAIVTPIKVPGKVESLVSKPALKKVFLEPECDDDFDNDEESDDDKDVDPDWKKTPLYRKIRSMRLQSRRRRTQMDDSDDDKENVGGVKRSSDGGKKCTCTGDCMTRRCSCRKSGAACSLTCRCNALKCTNKSVCDLVSDTSSKTSVDGVLNATFDLGNQSVAKKMRFSDTAEQFSADADQNSKKGNSSVREQNHTFVQPVVLRVNDGSPELF